ncbi:excinuclease ABC subunit UvrA [Candidatus Saccharibacteria bacterium]|nr:excinuclease ABC subunit UvrA [Candidatus Saccharibacteria bacterium]MCB9834855.1 excinuclease ABC subunit UvrA [Candidatus Nomurabacteria bacterium]
MQDKIVIKGAREHNLKNIDLELPRNKLITITGLSGSGKSTLAFDTLYAEGQRRYVESLSAYARQFLGLMNKPDVDQIDGLSPAISIDQKSSSRNPRSTVATVTEIYDYLRLIFARIGIPHHPVTGHPLTKKTATEIVELIKSDYQQSLIAILSPIVRDRKGEHQAIFDKLLVDGYLKVRVDGIIYDTDEAPTLAKNKKHTIEVIIDRFELNQSNNQRLSEAVESGLAISEGIIRVAKLDRNGQIIADTTQYSENYMSADGDNFSLPEIEPRLFSFNSPHGACQECTGLGSKQEIDPELVIPNPELSISQGAIRPWSRNLNLQGYYMQAIKALGEQLGFSLQTPIAQLTKHQLDALFYGVETKLAVKTNSGNVYNLSYEGIINNLERRYKETDSDYIRNDIAKYMREKSCQACKGRKLKPEVLAITVQDKSIADINDMTVEIALNYYQSLKLSDQEAIIARQILKEIIDRLEFLSDVGLNYLELGRSANTLAGGEAQRIRLATQIGSRLTGVLYILDEPSIGLHQRDNDRLITTLKRLRDIGNTVIVVEHDEDTIWASDYLVDIGPGAGKHGGQVVAIGTPKEVASNSKSLTGQYLSKAQRINLPSKRRKKSMGKLEIIGASEHNLKSVNVEIPLGKFVAVTGVSGSGKSTLINDTLVNALHNHFYATYHPVGSHQEIKGLEKINKLIAIDQSPIGRTPRSNPATYTKMFTEIREIFARTPLARERGYRPGRFSFNTKGGRCETCKGDGIIKIEMHFLPDVYVACEVCQGKRYSSETLEIKYKSNTIADVLSMTVEEAYYFFANYPALERKLATLRQVGLDYITLGQSATTLSGGEAQRIKLASELSKSQRGHTLYVLDEPTTGLHFEDVRKLLDVLQSLVDQNNTVLVIEHNLDVIKSADYLIDLGPEGGQNGGQVIATGTPEQVAEIKASQTGHYLKPYLQL